MSLFKKCETCPDKELCEVSYDFAADICESVGESDLVNIDTFGEDNIANKAMKVLREKFDRSYDWDPEMDYLANKESDRSWKPNGKSELQF